MGSKSTNDRRDIDPPPAPRFVESGETHPADRALRYILCVLTSIVTIAFAYVLTVYVMEGRWLPLLALPVFASFNVLCYFFSDAVSEVVTEYLPLSMMPADAVLYRDLDAVKLLVRWD
ncbi:MAG: hypothetical protein QM811_18080 [Pirellulales bacterium]